MQAAHEERTSVQRAPIKHVCQAQIDTQDHGRLSIRGGVEARAVNVIAQIADARTSHLQRPSVVIKLFAGQTLSRAAVLSH